MESCARLAVATRDDCRSAGRLPAANAAPQRHWTHWRATRFQAVSWKRTFANLMRREIMSLADKHCVPCKGGVPPLKGEQLELMKAQVTGWQVVDDHHLAKTFTFPDFRTALEFVNR